MSDQTPTEPRGQAKEQKSGAFGFARGARRVIQGDLSSLRVVFGLILIAIIFQVQESRFLSAENLTNLMLQITTIGLISVGIVYVLLLGEIDLSVGAVAGLAAAVMAVLNVKHGWNPYLAIAAAVVVGAAIGFAQGSLFSKFVVPSFVVTLAGLLTWEGALLQVLGETGSLNITDPKITGLANIFYSDTVGWIIAVVVVVAYGAVLALGYRKRVAAGLAELEPAAADPALRACVAVIVIAADRDPQLRSRRAAGGADPARLRGRHGVRRQADRPSAATSSPSAATPRRRGGPASASTASASPSSRSPARWRRSAAIMAASRLASPSTRTRAATNSCCWRSPAR